MNCWPEFLQDDEDELGNIFETSCRQLSHEASGKKAQCQQLRRGGCPQGPGRRLVR